MKIIGTAAARVDGVAKVTGQAEYVSDMTVPGMLCGKILRSPHAHARIVSIDTSAAERIPGVRAVLTREDYRHRNPYFSGKIQDHPIVALDRALFAGQPVAAVAADTEDAAEDALRAVAVEYEPLPAVVTIEEATADGAPLLHESAPGNVCFSDKLEKGDVAAGFAEADTVVEDTFTFPMVYHYAMEPHVAIAKVDADGLTVWSSTAHPFGVQLELAHIFSLPLSSVRVIIPYVGGAYGSKSGAKIEPLAVALAEKSGRPVRVAQNVSEAMMTVRRHSAVCRVRTGAKRDGTLVAKQAEVFLNTGAFAELGPVVTSRTLTRILGPYRLPHIRVESHCVYTNTVSAASFRSIGGPQTAWANESQMDILADELGLDPLAFRLKNLLHRGEELKPGGKPLDADLREGLRRVTDRMGWQGLAAPTGAGRGLAFGVTDPGAPLASTSTVHALSDGSVVVLIGTSEIGQGSRTVMSQIVAEELCVPLERVRVRPPDTAYTPYDRSTGSSRSTTVMGKATQLAAADAREQILELAMEHFEAPREAIELADGEARAGGQSVSYGELIRMHFAMQGGEIVGRGYAHSGMATTPSNPLFWEIGIGAVELDVDRDTGEVKLERYVMAADVGKALNPLQCEGQDEGAAMMGIGHTLMESIVYGDGQILNPNLVDYRVPGFENLPATFESILVENGDGPGPYGAKGMGEGGIIPVAPAVANAVFRRTGARVKDLPLTPEKVWRAIALTRTSKGTSC